MRKTSLLRTLIIIFVILAIGGGIFYFFQSQKEKKIVYQTEKVVRGNVQQKVSVSGTVIAASDINLNFRTAGKIKEIKVKVGDIVQTNETLATLDDFDAQNRVTQAQANLDLAISNREKTKAGVKSEEISVQNTTISNANRLVEINQSYVESIRKQTVQDLLLSQLQIEVNEGLVAEAQKNLDNDRTLVDKQIQQAVVQASNAQASLDQARKILDKTNALSEQSIRQAQAQKDNAVIYLEALRNARSDIQREIRQDNASESQKIQYDIQVTQAESSLDAATKNLDFIRAQAQSQEEEAQAQVVTAQNQVHQTNASLDTIRSQSQSQIDSSTSALDRAKTNLKVAKQNVENSKVQGEVRLSTAETQLINAQNQKALADAQLGSITATTREVDLAPLDAQVALAQAALELAQKQAEDTAIKAPVSGVITVINRTVGEEAQDVTPAITMIGEGKLQIESNVSETDISALKLGNKMSITFDALSPDQVFKGTLVSINPNSTVISGVTYYTIKAVFETTPEQKDLIKPGMTANLDIIADTAENVLLVPLQSIKTDKDNKYVDVLINNQSVKRVVIIGLQGEQIAEVKNGLNEGEMVITFSQEE